MTPELAAGLFAITIGMCALIAEGLKAPKLQYRSKRDGVIANFEITEAMLRYFIQNVHHFRDEALRAAQAPVDRIVIFDEAQRAWNSGARCGLMLPASKTGALSAAAVARPPRTRLPGGPEASVTP